ncbi:hypothetical protein MNEG_6286, partial [Monoraphidium neglectum]
PGADYHLLEPRTDLLSRLGFKSKHNRRARLGAAAAWEQRGFGRSSASGLQAAAAGRGVCLARRLLGAPGPSERGRAPLLDS